ncbi:MAG: hypothetical protein ACOYNC_15355 [Bacteroidales bacterium]
MAWCTKVTNQLKYFEDFIPHIRDVHVLEGISLIDNKMDSQTNTSLQKLLGDNLELCRKVKDNCIRSNVNNTYYISSPPGVRITEIALTGSDNKLVLPIELITVAKSIYTSINYKDEDRNHIGPVVKADRLKKYFQYVVESYPEPCEAQKVLYSLSVAPQAIRSLTDHEIAWITNIPIEKVKRILKHFCEHKEVRTGLEFTRDYFLEELITDTFDWKHDFFAEEFNKVSGEMLDPIDRDNINYFWSYNHANPLQSSGNKKEINAESIQSEKFGYSIFGISMLILAVRAIYPFLVRKLTFISFTDDFSPPLFINDTLSKVFANIDLSFLPVLTTLGLWSWYVTTIYRKVLSKLEEGNFLGRKLFSKFVAVWSLLCVIGTVVMPSLWVFLSGVGGFLLGLKYIQMTLPAKGESRIAFDEEFLTRLGNETTIHSLIMMLLGSGYIFFCSPFTGWINWQPPFTLVVLVTMVFFVGLTYFALLSIKQHTGENKVPMFLGVYKRYRSLYKPNKS